MNLNTNTGTISGTPAAAGTFNFTARVADSSTPTQAVTRALSITVNSAVTNAIVLENLKPGNPASECMAADSVRHHAGLGLAITRRIVALHGGDIEVGSTLGVGTVFSFDLPLDAPGPVTTTRRESPCRSASSSSCPAS